MGRTIAVKPAGGADGNDVVAGSSAGVIAAHVTARNAGTLDADTLQTVTEGGGLWKLDSGTRVRVLSAQNSPVGIVYQIEVMDGPSQGGQTWVAAESLP